MTCGRLTPSGRDLCYKAGGRGVRGKGVVFAYIQGRIQDFGQGWSGGPGNC